MAKNRCAYFCVVVMLAVFVYLYESGVTYVAVCAALLMPLFSLVLTLVSKRRFAVEEKLSGDNVVKGDTVTYRFIVTNRSFFPYSGIKAFFHADHNAIITDMDKQMFSVPPFGSRVIEYELQSRFRGVFAVGIKRIILYDTLGLFKFKQNITPSLTLTVLPKTVEISQLPLVSFEIETTSVNRNANTEDYSVISDLREYRPADSIKKVHWKMTAKKNALIVKNYQITSKNAAVLILDNSPVNPDLLPEEALIKEDLMMEAFVSVMAYCSKANYPLRLFYNESTEGADTAMGMYTGKPYYVLYSEAAKIKFDGEWKIADVLKEISALSTEFLNIVVFAQKLDAEMLKYLAALKHIGHNVILMGFWLDGEKSGFDYADELVRIGGAFYEIHDESGIEILI